MPEPDLNAEVTIAATAEEQDLSVTSTRSEALPPKMSQTFWNKAWWLAKMGAILSVIGVLFSLGVQLFSGNSVAFPIANVAIGALKALGFSVSIGTATTFGAVSTAVTFAGAAAALIIGLLLIFIIFSVLKSLARKAHKMIFLDFFNLISGKVPAEANQAALAIQRCYRGHAVRTKAAQVKALCQAIEDQNTEIFDALLQKPLSEEALSEGLRTAISKGNEYAFDALLPSISDPELLYKGLRTAISKGNEYAFDALLQKDFPEQALIEGFFVAIEHGNEHAFDALLQKDFHEQALIKGLRMAIEKGNEHAFNAFKEKKFGTQFCMNFKGVYQAIDTFKKDEVNALLKQDLSETVLSEGLDIAISRRNDDAVEVLLPKISDSGLLCKGLCTAIEKHNIKACKALLKKISIEDLLQRVSDPGVLCEVFCIKIEDGETASIDALLKKPLSQKALAEGLCKAIEHGNEHAFDALIKKPWSQEALAEGLCMAIQKGNQTAFDALLPFISKETLLNFKTKNDYGHTLIGLALIYVAEPSNIAAKSQAALAIQRCYRGHAVRTKAAQVKALCQAIEDQNTEIFDALLQSDRASDDKIPGQLKRFHALMDATSLESIDLNQLYFDNGQGCTALQVALNTEIVQFLLTKMSTKAVNAQNHNGDTALMFATRVHHWSMIEALLDNPKVDVNLQNKFGNTALKQIFSSLKVDCLAKKEMGILLRLIAVTTPANINHYGSGGTTIHAAISSSGSAEVLKVLLKRGANPKINLICDGQCISPLILAVQCGNAQMVRYLLQYGAVVDQIKQGNGQTALHWAAQMGNAEILKILLDHIKESGTQSDLLALIHLKNAYGDTALDRARHCKKHRKETDQTGHMRCIVLLKPFNQTAIPKLIVLRNGIGALLCLGGASLAGAVYMTSAVTPLVMIVSGVVLGIGFLIGVMCHYLGSKETGPQIQCRTRLAPVSSSSAPRLRLAAIAEDPHAEKSQAALAIQRCYRGHAVRTKAAKEEKAAEGLERTLSYTP